MLKGLIFTNTEVLAQNLRVQQKNIQKVLHQYVIQCSSCIEWYIVDVSDPMYADIVDCDDWQTYRRILSDYYYGLGFSGVNNCPLFIIGGIEEIPMPLIENPLVGIGGEYLYSDMLYCFDLADFSYLHLDTLINQTPQFTVGRLPLSSRHSISDLSTYLNTSSDYLQSGIYVRGASMTTTESWVQPSTDIMRDIPIVSLSSDNVPLYNRMIVSPPLDTTYQDMYEGYVHELQNIDFLTCNLHGDDTKGNPFFFGEDQGRSYSTIAIQPSMFKYACPVIFNPLACYGARFIDYDIDDSMLYSALRNGTMLYTGSCDISMGGDYYQAGCSELMIKLYNIYLHQGMPAGMALIKAKQDYYRTCHSDDGDENAMFTILEFNLFGCPILSMKPKFDVNYRPQLSGQYVVTKARVNYHPTKIVHVKGDAMDANGILTYVRGLVDANLFYVRAKVEKEVYERLGLSASNIERISRVMQNEYQIGWQFMYMITPNESYRSFRMYYVINTNEQGEITKILHTK